LNRSPLAGFHPLGDIGLFGRDDGRVSTKGIGPWSEAVIGPYRFYGDKWNDFSQNMLDEREIQMSRQ
jgi:hypothetical protein